MFSFFRSRCVAQVRIVLKYPVSHTENEQVWSIYTCLVSPPNFISVTTSKSIENVTGKTVRQVGNSIYCRLKNYDTDRIGFYRMGTHWISVVYSIFV